VVRCVNFWEDRTTILVYSFESGVVLSRNDSFEPLGCLKYGRFIYSKRVGSDPLEVSRDRGGEEGIDFLLLLLVIFFSFVILLLEQGSSLFQGSNFVSQSLLLSIVAFMMGAGIVLLASSSLRWAFKVDNSSVHHYGPVRVA
jgi:hypothetical protein